MIDKLKLPRRPKIVEDAALLKDPRVREYLGRRVRRHLHGVHFGRLVVVVCAWEIAAIATGGWIPTITELDKRFYHAGIPLLVVFAGHFLTNPPELTQAEVDALLDRYAPSASAPVMATSNGAGH